MKSLSHVWLLATPWTAAHQASPSMRFCRQEYWSGLPLPSLTISCEIIKWLFFKPLKFPVVYYTTTITQIVYMCGLLLNHAWELSLGKKSSLKFWNYSNKIVWPGGHRSINLVQMGLECHVAKDLQKLRFSLWHVWLHKASPACSQGGDSLPQGQLCQGSWVASNNNRLWKVVKWYTRTHRIKATTEASGPEMSKARGNKDPEHLICDQQ